MSESEGQKLLAGLQSSPKTVPCSFLYDSRGSALYDQIVELPEYYPYKTELGMLNEQAQDILRQVPTGSVVVELGCGSATKTGILLQALLQRDGPEHTFFEGIDVSADFLDNAKANLLAGCKGMKTNHVGTICEPYLQGLQTARNRHPDKVLCVLWLGSSIGNLEPTEALQFFQDVLRIGGTQTQIFVCADLWKDGKVLHGAYDDSQGVTEAFIKNGLANALKALGLTQESPDVNAWPYHCVVNPKLQQVEMWLEAPEDLHEIAPGVTILRGERVLMEVSRKFTQDKLRSLAFQAGFFWQASWMSPLYSMQMLSAPSVALQSCWADEDAFFAAIRDWDRLPIDLRMPFCFYYAHVTSFSSIKCFPEAEPSKYDIMFSRGVDPDVDDPTKCHAHPEAPPVWPPKHKIVDYVKQARTRIMAAAQANQVPLRRIYLALEHSRMHLETLQYMLLQQRKQDFQAALASDQVDVHDAACKLLDDWSTTRHAEAAAVPVPAGFVMLGVDVDPSKAFAWDNEGPLQAPQHVGSFAVAAQPVSVQQFLEFVCDPEGYSNPRWWADDAHQAFNTEGRGCPATWTVKGGRAWVHTMEGTVGWKAAAQQPAWVCLAEANAYCASRGMRVMTELEYCRALDAVPARVHKLMEGGWELLSTPFQPLDGFKAMPEYPEYSTDFFDGKHFVLRGSSPATHSSAIRPSFRNFYQGRYPFHWAKFHVCKAE